jgi:hypothetical protein
MLVRARIFPSNEVVVSRVAELPTFQNTPAPAPVLITLTTDPGEVIRVLGIWIGCPSGNGVDTWTESKPAKIRR